MNETINCATLIAAVEAAVKKLEEKRGELDILDSEIGDGDHGRTINNAFQSILPFLTREEGDIGKLLGEIGRKIAFSTGAATGPLYGTGIMGAGKVVTGKSEIALADIVDMLTDTLLNILHGSRSSFEI